MPRWITAIFWGQTQSANFYPSKTKRVFGTPAKKCSTFAAHYSARPLHAAAGRKKGESGEQFKQKIPKHLRLASPNVFLIPPPRYLLVFNAPTVNNAAGSELIGEKMLNV
jgi:hypothetical protein